MRSPMPRSATSRLSSPPSGPVPIISNTVSLRSLGHRPNQVPVALVVDLATDGQRNRAAARPSSIDAMTSGRVAVRSSRSKSMPMESLHQLGLDVRHMQLGRAFVVFRREDDDAIDPLQCALLYASRTARTAPPCAPRRCARS